jgi:hypothetical protein
MNVYISMNLSCKLRVAVLSTAFVFADAGTDSISGTSSNWSGYIAQNGVYTGVSATWTIPVITPSTTIASNATWVGIGGKSSNDLIQAGDYEIANSDGVTYQAWYELLPGDSTPINLAVSPGDSLSVAILETSEDTWNIVLTNNTTKQQFEQTVNYTSSLSSAEWIQERPLINGELSTLSGFTPVTFTGATVVENGQRVTMSIGGAQIINLINTPTNTAMAVPSPIASDGTSFSVMRTSVQATDTPSTEVIPEYQQIPPFELHRTGRTIVTWNLPGITWVIQQNTFPGFF